MDILKLGIEINPIADELYLELARTALQSGDKIQAEHYFQQCLSINPHNWEAAKWLNELHQNQI